MIKLDVLSSNELSIFSIMYLNLLKIKVYEKKIRSTHVLFYSHYPKLIWFFFFNLFFLAALGLRCRARAFSSCGERGLLFVVVCRLLIVVASLVAEHGF